MYGINIYIYRYIYIFCSFAFWTKMIHWSSAWCSTSALSHAFTIVYERNHIRSFQLCHAVCWCRIVMVFFFISKSSCVVKRTMKLFSLNCGNENVSHFWILSNATNTHFIVNEQAVQRSWKDFLIFRWANLNISNSNDRIIAIEWWDYSIKCRMIWFGM